jgi:hypothetical protein
VPKCVSDLTGQRGEGGSCWGGKGVVVVRHLQPIRSEMFEIVGVAISDCGGFLNQSDCSVSFEFHNPLLYIIVDLHIT